MWVSRQSRTARMKIDYKLIIENLSGMYAIFNTNFEYIAVSNDYTRSVMKTREEMIGKNVFDVFPNNPYEPHDGTDKLKESLEKVIALGIPNTMENLPYDIKNPQGIFEKKWWSVTNSPILDDRSKVCFIINHAKDITEFVLYKMAADLQRKKDLEALEKLTKLISSSSSKPAI